MGCGVDVGSEGECVVFRDVGSGLEEGLCVVIG